MAKQTPDACAQIFRGNNIPFEAEEIQHGRKFTFEDGAILCVYETGRQTWGGKVAPSKERITKLLGAPGPTGNQITAPGAAGEVHRQSNKVFIVYGHDAAAREQLELLLRRLKLEPVVLQNLPSGGQTIIEKLETSGDVHYACALLTPDDDGRKKGEPDFNNRARQNVVLELGMFLAKLGRKRVAILHKGNIELPSDIAGLLYIPFVDRIDEIKEKVAAELQEAGFSINIKDLLS